MTTTYRYLLADLLTNEVIAELPFTGVQFTQQLNQAGTLTARLLLSGISADAYNAYDSTVPARNAIYVDRNGILVWGGIIWGRTYNSNSQEITINAREFDSYFERRRINQDIVFTNVDQLQIAQTLVSFAQGQPYGNIGVAIGAETSGILLSRTYYNYELKTVYGALQDLSRAEDGFDFNVTVSYNGAGEATKTLTLGYPRIGTTYSEFDPYAIYFELPGNLLEYEYPEDGSIAANKVYSLGAGSNEGKLISIQTDPTKFADGWALLEEQANYSDVTDQAYLDQLAIGQVNAVSYPPTVIKIVAPAYQAPEFGTYKIGDDARLRITDSFFPNTLDQVYRIVGLNVQPGEDEAERVTITLTKTTN